LVRRPEGKRPLGRPGHRWEDNIRIDLQEIGGFGLFIWLRIGTRCGLLWSQFEPSGYIRGRDFID